MARRRLSLRQKQRIASIQERRRQRLADRMERTLHGASEDRSPREGLVIARHGANLAVEDQDGRLHHCLSRQNLGQIVCGDQVIWQPTFDHNGVVIALQTRDTVLSRPDYNGHPRPLAANITQLVAVLAPSPEPSEYLLDQYLVAAETIGVQALITLNKMDLLDADQALAFRRRFSLYAGIGYRVIHLSATDHRTLEPLLQQLGDQTSILLGQSGVGKSSLIKVLLPDRRIQIGRLSEATGLGRHTTSATTFYHLPEGGALIDSPGVRSFHLQSLSRNQLEWGFREFRSHLGHCRFSDCHHRQEPGCALRAAVQAGTIDPRRLDNFLHMADQLCDLSSASPD